MKFSIIAVALLGLTVSSYGAPIDRDLNERALDKFDLNELSLRELYEILDARTGSFHQSSSGTKHAAHAFIDSAHHGGQLSTASASGSSAKTAMSNNAFHLDRQQPSNSHGTHKVAVQLNHVSKGHSSTVGQVAIHGHHEASSREVAKKLKHSVTTGKETHINHPDSKKAHNIAHESHRSDEKTHRHESSARAGEHRAASGDYKKGRH